MDNITHVTKNFSIEALNEFMEILIPIATDSLPLVLEPEYKIYAVEGE